MALVMLLLVGGVAMGQSQSKTYYTLTNGRLWWSNGLESDNDQTYRDPVAFDASRSDARGNWLEVHPHGSEHVTHITAKGDTYLKLDITDPTNPKITTSNAFDIYCAWQRTGTAGATGYYFQEWYDETSGNTYCYYLVGTQNNLKVIHVLKGDGLSESSYWYDWDFGAAVWETPTIDGVKKSRYYWIMLSTIDREGHEITPVWTMSRHSYQRPEDIQFTSYDVAADAPTNSTTARSSNMANLRYYDDVAASSQIDYYGATQTIGHSPAGNGALVLPVTVIPHDEDIREMATIDDSSDPNYGKRYGLQKEVDAHNVTTGAGIEIANGQLHYGVDESTSVTAKIVCTDDKKVTMTVVPAYTEYKEETYRRGINLNYHNRTSDVFGSAGVPTYDEHFFDGSTMRAAAPLANRQETQVNSIVFSVDNRSLRYVSIDTLDWRTHPENLGKATLNFDAPCNGYHTVYVYVRVRYKNGAEQRDTATLTLHFDKPSITPQPEKGPVVRGALFGGGRMANVTGGTAVYIHSTDSIPTVYGGNDIAGWVQGDAGANLYIGTEFTSKDHPVHIGSVYGGGNGYYTYQGINAGYDEATGGYYNPYWKMKSTSLMYSAYYFNGKVYPWHKYPDGYLTALTNDEADRINKDQSEWSSLTPVTNHQFEYTPFYIGRPDLVDQAETGDDGDGTIPYIKTAHITVGVPEGKDNGGNATFFVDAEGDSTHWHNDYILIDTIFGGARNAFIGVESNEENPANGVTIDFNGGTCYAVFGGNNVGGSVANTSTVFVNVHDTKLIPADKEYADTYLNGYGRDFGIRYLFGGGNLVDGSHANVTISGGMIDTAYLGGNKATVKNPIGTVECLMGGDGVNQRTGFGYDGHYIMSNTTYPSFKNMGTGWVAKYESTPSFFDSYGPDNFHPEEGQYNVRCLFGGNNSADMDNITTIQLHSGGISCVYGGGNEGDMTNDNLFNVTGPVSGTGTALDGNYLGCGDNMLFPNPLYNYLIADAFDLNTDGTPKADGWAALYGKRTLPSKVGTLVTALENSQITCDYVFGGSRMGNIKNSCGVYLMGGIYGYVNGGNDVSGDIGSTTENEGAYLFLGGNTLVVGDAVSGSDGYYHCEDPDKPGHYDDKPLYDTYASDDAESYDPYNDFEHMLFPTHNRVNFYLKGGLILGQTVAGAVHANVGFEGPKGLIKRLDTDPESQTYGTRVEQEFTIPGGEKSGVVRFLATGGHVLGNGFGGGFQSDIYGLTYLTIQGNTQYDGSFFAGNDCTGSTTTFSAYYNTNDYDRYRAQGKTHEQALDLAYADMVASDGITPLNTHDGSWNALYTAYLRINDTPRIHCVYGSGNGAYNYHEDRPHFEEISYCEPITGRNLLPQQSSSFIDIHTSGPHHYTENPHSPVGIDTVFGGGNGVGVETGVVVLLNNEDPDGEGAQTGADVYAVRTIFGGNNIDDMRNAVPDIRLLMGQVKTVYGGCNNGVMAAKKNDFNDVLGKPVKDVSTHVVVESVNARVIDTIFGGCRMSDVEGNTFVEVKNTHTEGINYVFGGNDISGAVKGYTRIDISGGTVKNLFGGSDGRYDYVEVGDSLYNIYPYGSVARNDTAWTETVDGRLVVHSRRYATASRPDVDSANVNLWGGTVGVTAGGEFNGIYGGGAMADCNATHVVVNDTVVFAKDPDVPHPLHLAGILYGGGMGNFSDLNQRDLRGGRYGDINGSTHVDLYHAESVAGGKAYGGGRGGDVENTYINTHEGWNTPFDELYGGCWGADVHGTAHLDFKGAKLVKNLFGGNDFAGDVYKSVINIHSGIFTNIYGAGNGYYADNAYNSGNYADDTSDPLNPVIRHIHRPNNEYVEINFDNGTVEGNLYGGGRMGSTWAYKKNASREYEYDVHGHKIPDTDRTTGQAHTNPLDYAYVITNIHGGDFRNNVFGGASGRDGSSTDALVYGLKVVNMDGGNVHMSLYGGSESVNDGYSSECTGVLLSETTLRPSSIINMKGGTVESNLYGAGYLGTTYGSVYVNVGTDAIDSCVAYTRSYSSGAKSTVDSAYWIFKPGEKGSLSDALVETPVVLNHSVYAGANWGAGAGSSSFTTAGFKGGESMIRIDGKGYNTSADELNPNPQMNIRKSLFGSGTSVKGGDVRSDIDLWNYGELDNCRPTKELESVQRADHFFSHNTAVHYLGATDATDAYISEPYSILRAHDMGFRGFNVAEYDAKVDKVSNLYFYQEPLDNTGALQLVHKVDIRRVETSEDACGTTATTCGATYVVDPIVATKQHTLLILNNGIDFTIRAENNLTPGNVYGYGHVFTPAGYSSSITAQATATNLGGEIVSLFDFYGSDDPEDIGLCGFSSPCDTSNKYTNDLGGFPVIWEDYTSENHDDAEYPFKNYTGSAANSDYREWKVGTGVRLREAAIRAHIDPTQLAEDVNVKIGTPSDTNLALAKASITLPATSTGHYYKFNNDGIIISGSNSTANLVDEAWSTTTDFATLATDYSAGTNVNDKGSWKKASLEEGGLLTGRSLILNYPDNTFGLVLQPGENFETNAGRYVMPSGVNEAMSTTVLSGNSYYNASASFCSPKVASGDRIMPTMDLLLTYSPTFSTTFLGTVEFTLDEYDENNDSVGPVKVKVYLSTIIESFRDMETSVLAMFNNDVTNTFTRRVILPITLDENRELFITSVKWEPTDGNGNSTPSSDKFYLAENESTITGAARTPTQVNNLFGMHLVPNDAVTGELNENLGWTTIDENDINIFRLARAAGTDPQKFAADGNTAVDLTSEGAPNGRRLGVLDGRGSAALNVTLLFDGSRVYPANDDKGYLGKVVLGMKWKKGENSGNYNFTIYVKTRSHGDTIYLASANSVTRGSYTVEPYTHDNSYYLQLLGSSEPDSVAKAPTVIGKSPDCYVQSFQHALSSNVYQEGDVIAIMDQVNINTKPVHIQGADGPPIQVIRYDGHHHELPDEVGVYRGPMIVVSGEGKLFTAQNIDFHGSAGAKIKRVDGSNPTGFKTHHIITVGETTYDWTDTVKDRNHFEPDTNRAFGPIIAIKNNGAVTLSEGTLVRHNWNAYGSEAGQTNASGLPLSSENMGAISVTDGGTLTLKGDVTVRDNLSHTITGYDDQTPVSVAKAPGNGAIYVDGGKIVLPESHKNTAIDITRNRLMDPLVHTNPSSVRWWQMATITRTINDVPTQIPSQFTLDTTLVYTNWKKANVYLTRTAPSSGSATEKELNDVQSDVIRITGSLGTHTRIGVRKWFPGPTTRDTMRIAVNDGYDFAILDNVYKNKNFQSDDGFKVFYNQNVNNVALYFFRCATFRHQVAGAALPLAGATGEDVLYYGPLYSNTCPTGGDTILYRVQGGLMPYTFTWEGAGTDHVHTKPYANTLVQSKINEGDNSYFWASIVDTFITHNVMTSREPQTIAANVKVTAVDATGVCELSKNITIRAHLVSDLGVHDLWEPVTSPDNGWTDTNSANDGARKSAVGDRYFRGVKITPMVSADPSAGLIAATFNDGDFRVYQYNSNTDSVALPSRLFCEGDKITLKTFANKSLGQHFLMWSFNPYTTNPATYVVPGHDDDVIAYYGPDKYWKDQVKTSTIGGAALSTEYNYTTRPTVTEYTVLDGAEPPTATTEAGYVTTYHGDVHIYNENGLAWFISVVNGLNGVQARPMRFNTVYIHKKDAAGTPYDMKMFRWTPVGTLQYGFRGDFIGVSEAVADTAALTADYVTIKGFIVDEPDMDNVGVFSFLDGARVKGINLQNVFVRGGQYASALAATSKNSHISKVAVDKLTNGQGGGAQTSIITTHYTSGTIFGQSVKDTIDNVSVDNIKFAVDALYIGGLAGQAKSSYATNSDINVALSANVQDFGGAVGQATGSGPEGLFAFLRKSNGQGYIANNYIHIRNAGLAQNIGGVVGHAENTVLENNYVYGLMQGSNNDGGVAATMGQNSKANKNYYPLGDAKNAVGDVSGNASLSDISSFSGSGNKVTLEEPVYGVNNLTRVLNKWVREQNAQGGNFKTWRSDLVGANGGYPVFGDPDLIPVYATATLDGCGEVLLDDIVYTSDTVVTSRIIDSVEMVDSTLTATIRLHYGTEVFLSDSASLDEGYYDNGFALSSYDLQSLEMTHDSAGHSLIILHDTLSTAYGCDSVVTLTLVFANGQDPNEEGSKVNAYPNPTISVVYVEADGMSHVEVYDNEGRRLQDYDASNTSKITVDMRPYTSGIYFIRVHMPKEVVIQKIIKQR